MKTYRGFRVGDGCAVEVHCWSLFQSELRTPVPCIAEDDSSGGWYFLPSRIGLDLGLPPGFDWGYLGAGPSSLALAILADAIDEKTAFAQYEQFVLTTIGRLHGDTFEMTDEQIRGGAADGTAIDQEPSPELLVSADG